MNDKIDYRVTTTDLFDNGDNRSYSDYAWLDSLGWKRKLPVIARQFNDFMVYRRFCKNASQEEIWQLHKIQDKEGLTAALETMIRELENKRFNAYTQKENFVREQLAKRPVNIRELDEQFAEEERWRDLPYSERRLKYIDWPVMPGKAAEPIPLEMLVSQPIVEEQIADDGCGYRIYDKIYNAYSAVVFSPMRVNSDGTPGVGTLVRRQHMADLHTPIRQLLSEERRNYMNWLAQGNRQSAQTQPMTGLIMNRIPNAPRAASAKVNIDHVKKAMGLQGNRLNEELNGDIF